MVHPPARAGGATRGWGTGGEPHWRHLLAASGIFSAVGPSIGGNLPRPLMRWGLVTTCVCLALRLSSAARGALGEGGAGDEGGGCGSAAVREQLSSLRRLHADGLLTDAVWSQAQTTAVERCLGGGGGGGDDGLARQLRESDAPRTITIDRDHPISADMHIPPNVLLRFEMGGRILLGEGVNLTIAGPLSAPPTQIFVTASNRSRVLFLSGLSGPLLPQWWGATADDATVRGPSPPPLPCCPLPLPPEVCRTARRTTRLRSSSASTPRPQPPPQTTSCAPPCSSPTASTVSTPPSGSRTARRCGATTRRSRGRLGPMPR